MTDPARNLKVFCVGSARMPHPDLQIARLSAFWTDESGNRFLQDRTKIPDGSKRAEVLRLSGERVRRETPVGEEGGLMYRAPDGREHVVRPPTPSGQMGTIAEADRLTWVFTCPRCQGVDRADHHQMSNRRVFKAAFASVAAGKFKVTIGELEFLARQQG